MENLFYTLANRISRGDYQTANFQSCLLISILRSSCDYALRLMTQDFTDYKSTMVQVMIWCSQATNHYLSQCSSRSLWSFSVARLRQVKTLSPNKMGDIKEAISNAFSFKETLDIFHNFATVCSLVSNCQKIYIDLGNDLAQNRRQTINWTNGHPVNWRIRVSPWPRCDENINEKV